MSKPIQQLLSIALVFLFMSPPALAQDKQPRTTDILRDKIEKLEKTDVSTRAQSVKDIYKRSLLRLYGELTTSIQGDVAALKSLQSAVSDADSEQQAEIAAQIRRLTSEQTEASNKIRRIKDELQAASVQAPRAQRVEGADAETPVARQNPPVALVAFAGQSKSGITLPRGGASLGAAVTSTDTLPAAKAEEAALPALALQGTCYPDVPDVIATNVDDVAKTIVSSKNADRYSARHEDIFFYTVADAVASTNDPQNIRALKAYRFLGETARTDKHIGASSRSEGSTTAVEKPGFADLLGWAVEHGAVQQEVDGTTLTLSSSPYALVAAANGGDTAENYREYDFLNRLGVSATFNISDQDNVLASASRKQLTEWSARLRLTGDRSTRSQDFEDFWNANIRPRVRARLLLLNRAGGLLETDPKLGAVDNNGDTLNERLNTEIRNRIIAILNTADSDDKKTSDIKSVILCRMRQAVYDPVAQGGDNMVSQATRTRINSELVPALFKAHEDLVQARKLINDFLAEAGRKPLTTLAYNNYRTAVGSDYSVFRFLYERNAFSPMKMVANAGVSFYHHPDRTINQQSVRDFALALSFEGKARSPFVTSELDMSNITYSFSGRYQRTLENRGVPGRKADIAVAQFKLEFPVLAGINLPFSVTYANATELIKEDHIRANFGLSFDTSKLLNLRKLNQLLSGGQ